MQWTTQILVVLLNIVWVAFFLQPHPFSVFVQRRNSDSTDGEMLFGEFCIQPQDDKKWTSNLHSVNITSNKTINTTSEVSRGSNLTLNDSSVRDQEDQNKTKSQQNCQCNNASMQQKDLSQLSDIDLRPPAPGCEPKIIMKFPNMEVCIDVEIYFSAIAPVVLDWHEMTPSSPPLLGQTSSEVTSAFGLTTTQVKSRSKAPVQWENNRNRGSRGVITASCCIRYTSARFPFKLFKGYSRQPLFMCPIDAIILHTYKNRLICVDPKSKWVQKLIKLIDSKKKNMDHNEPKF